MKPVSDESPVTAETTNETVAAARTKESLGRTLSFSRQDVERVLADTNYSPEQLITLVRSDFSTELSGSVGVHEGYDLMTHLRMSMGQFEKYFADKELSEDVDKNFFRVLQLFHDIGKPKAVEERGKQFQHEETLRIIRPALEALGYSPAQIAIAEGLTSGDPIGEILKPTELRDDTLEHAAKELLDMEERSGLAPENFRKLLDVYYQVDASSYTPDAGGTNETMAKLFAFDHKKGTLAYSSSAQKRIAQLEAEVSKQAKERLSKKELSQSAEQVERNNEREARAQQNRAVLEAAKQTTERLKDSEKKITTILEQETFDFDTADRMLKDLTGILREAIGVRLSIRELLDRSGVDLLKISFDATHPLLYAHAPQGTDQIPDYLPQVLGKLRTQEVEIDRAKDALSRIQEKDEAADKAVANESRIQRLKAEEQIKELSGFFGLGVLPGTRSFNRFLLERTQRILTAINQLENARSGPADDLQGELYRIKYEYSFTEFERLYELSQELASTRNDGRIASNEIARKEKEYQSELTSFKGSVQHKLKEIKLDAFQENISTCTSQIEIALKEIGAIDKILEDEVFPTLHISRTDENLPHPTHSLERGADVEREIRERSFENIREMTRSFFAYFHSAGRKSPELLAEELCARVKEIQQSARICFNDEADHFAPILKDGFIRSVFDLPEEHQRKSRTFQSGGQDHLNRRLQAERALGFMQNEHPIAMALGSTRDRAQGPASSYGAFHVAFPLEFLRNRCLCTVSDSLNPMGIPPSLRRRKSWLSRAVHLDGKVKVQSRQVTLEHAIIAKALLELDAEYEPKPVTSAPPFMPQESDFYSIQSFVEIMVAGGPVPVSEATEVVLSRDGAEFEIEALIKQFSSHRKLTAQLKKQFPRVAFRVSGEPSTQEGATEKYQRLMNKFFNEK